MGNKVYAVVGIAELLALTIFIIVAAAEWAHKRRCRRLASLAFGPENGPRRWVALTPAMRAISLSLLAWGFVTLMTLDPKVFKETEIEEDELRHIVLVLDVSPSMKLDDAGPEGDMTRSRRASDVVRSLLQRIALDRTRISVVAVYNGAKCVVEDVSDVAVIENILNDLPLEYAFDIGKTNLVEGFNVSAELAEQWPEDSATLLVVTDGDTIPDEGMPDMPDSIASILVVGVGDTRSSIFIDGHQSRQNQSSLRQIARRLEGAYYDGNEKHLPSEALRYLSETIPMQDREKWGRRESALLAILLGGVIFALIPAALAQFGSSWNVKPRTSKSDPKSVGELS
jgi:Ca-activated chloride channel homolog